MMDWHWQASQRWSVSQVFFWWLVLTQLDKLLNDMKIIQQNICQAQYKLGSMEHKINFYCCLFFHNYSQLPPSNPKAAKSWYLPKFVGGLDGWTYPYRTVVQVFFISFITLDKHPNIKDLFGLNTKWSIQWRLPLTFKQRQQNGDESSHWLEQIPNFILPTYNSN